MVRVEAVYSRSRTAWEEDLGGGVVSAVALGTEDLSVGMVLWSSVQKP